MDRNFSAIDTTQFLMKALLFLLLCSISCVASAQRVCTIDADNANTDFCTACSQVTKNGTEPAIQNGIFSGKLIVNTPGTIYMISANCLNNVVFAGQVTIQTIFKSDLGFAQDPTVADNTTVTAQQDGKQTKHQTIEAYGVQYTPDGNTYNYEAFSARMSTAGTTGRTAGPIVGPGDAASSLPVTLMDWSATAVDGDIHLSWSTATESDNAFFAVEYSRDGRAFTEITRAAGATVSATARTYAYIHAGLTAGTHFFRLSQYDLDGTRTDFPVLQVDGGLAPHAISGVYPNPASPGSTIRLEGSAGAGSITLLGPDGRTITQYAATGGIELPADLAGGIYFLRSGGSVTKLLVR